MRPQAIILGLLAFITLGIENASAQGGMGKMPREDVVLMRQAMRDSLSEEVYQKIFDLKRYAEAKQLDSAALFIAYNGKPTAPEGKWARGLDLQNADEKSRAEALLSKLSTLFQSLPKTEQKYYAVFKDKNNPAGQMHLFQISFSDGGKKSRMVSFNFYPVDDKMMLGDFN